MSGVVMLFGFSDAQGALLAFSRSQISSVNQEACRNSNAAGTARGNTARNSSSKSASAFRFGGSWNNTGPSFPAAASGSIVARNRGTKSSVPFSRLMCVMTWCALIQSENGGSLRNPFLDRRLFHQLPEGEVHLDRIQLGGVVSCRNFFCASLAG